MIQEHIYSILNPYTPLPSEITDYFSTKSSVPSQEKRASLRKKRKKHK